MSQYENPYQTENLQKGRSSDVLITNETKISKRLVIPCCLILMTSCENQEYIYIYIYTYNWNGKNKLNWTEVLQLNEYNCEFIKRCHDGRDCCLWRTVMMSKNIAIIWICCYISLALKFPLFPLLKFWKEKVNKTNFIV